MYIHELHFSEYVLFRRSFVTKAELNLSRIIFNNFSMIREPPVEKAFNHDRPFNKRYQKY